MADLIAKDEGTPSIYVDMLARLLPRGPIWQLLGGALQAFVTGLAEEPRRFHNRLVDWMDECDPRTADETLERWVEVYDLPAPCGTMPEDNDRIRVLLTARAAAIGGNSLAYFQGLADLLAPGTVISESPYDPFTCGVSRCGEELVSCLLVFHWLVTYTFGDPGELPCILAAYKPAHTVLESDQPHGLDGG
jgi:uncharacterized protein YmfQ (DUF2313 family)